MNRKEKEKTGKFGNPEVNNKEIMNKTFFGTMTSRIPKVYDFRMEN
jgi:hypothetical protein